MRTTSTRLPTAARLGLGLGLGLGLMMIAGCGARGLAPRHPRELFPRGAYNNSRPHMIPCEEAQRYVLAEQQLHLDRPPPIPGDDRLPLTVQLDVRARLVEVVALEIVHQDPSYRLFVGIAPRDKLSEDIVMPDTEAWGLTARILMRARVQGGLFDELAYCHEQWTEVELAPEERTVSLVVDDDPRSAAGQSSLIWFDSVLMREPEPAQQPKDQADPKDGQQPKEKGRETVTERRRAPAPPITMR